MRIRILVVLLLVWAGAAAFADPPPAKEADKLKSEMQSIYKGIDDSFQKLNWEQAHAVETPDYETFDDRGTRVDVPQARQKQAQIWQKVKAFESRTQVLDAFMDTDGTATVNIDMDQHITLAGGDLIDLRGKATEKWIQTADGWKRKLRRYLSLEQSHTHAPNASPSPQQAPTPSPSSR